MFTEVHFISKDHIAISLFAVNCWLTRVICLLHDKAGIFKFLSREAYVFSNQAMIFDFKFDTEIVRATNNNWQLFISFTDNMKCFVLIDYHCYEVIILE